MAPRRPELAHQPRPPRGLSVTLIVMAVMLMLACGATGVLWWFLRASHQGAQRMRQVVEVGQAHEDARALEPALAKTLAYAQLINQGDLSFQQDLTKQLERIDASVQHLESLRSALSNAEQGVLQQLHAQWQVCQRSLGSVLALAPGVMWGEQALLAQAAIQRDLDQLQTARGLLEEASARHWETATATARQWSSQLPQHGLRWVGGFLLLLVGGLAVLWWRVLRPLRELRRAVEAFASGSRSLPLAITSHDEFGELAGAFNQLMEKRWPLVMPGTVAGSTVVPPVELLDPRMLQPSETISESSELGQP